MKEDTDGLEVLLEGDQRYYVVGYVYAFYEELGRFGILNDAEKFLEIAFSDWDKMTGNVFIVEY